MHEEQKKKKSGLDTISNKYGLGGKDSTPIIPNSTPSDSDNVDNEQVKVSDVSSFNPAILDTKGKQLSHKNNFDALSRIKEERENEKVEGKPLEEKVYDEDYEIYETDDPELGMFNKWEVENKKETVQWEKDQRSDYDTIHNSLLSGITKDKANSLKRINGWFDKRIEEQKRINKQGIDRLKAYGLSGDGGSALYSSNLFSDVISNKERANAKELDDIVTKQENLITEANLAFEKGNTNLTDKLRKEYLEIAEKRNEKIDDIEKESSRQYDLIKEVRVEKEKKTAKEREEKIEELSNSLIPNGAKYSEMTPNEIYLQAESISKQTGVPFADVLSSINKAISENQDTRLSKQKIETEKNRGLKTLADIKNVNNTIYNRNRKTTNDIKEDSEDKDGDVEFTSGEKKKLEGAGLSDASRQQKLDYLYKNKEYKKKYTFEKPSFYNKGKNDEAIGKLPVNTIFSIGDIKYKKIIVNGEEDYKIIK